MIEITDKNIKTWSTIGSRPTFGIALTELSKYYDELIVVTADVSSSAGLDRYRKLYPDKFLDVGIAEQNMIGIAAGLADNGFNVYTTTFAPFQTLRCCEQIKVNLAYSNINVKMVGLASGLINGPLGNTHCCIEDIGALRSIPNLVILSPADGLGIVKSIIATMHSNTPTYIRLTGGANNPTVYDSDFDYKIGKAVELISGKDLTIFATGSMVHNSLIAAKILFERGVYASVWDMHTIKPIDEDAIFNAIHKNRFLVTVEEHNIIGGLASAVAECSSRYNVVCSQLSLGIKDVFLEPGDYQFMQHQCGLTALQIADSILKFLK